MTQSEIKKNILEGKRNNLAASLIYILLLKSGKYSFLPELLDVVGEDKMMELLELFAGVKFQFPSMDELKKHAKEVTVFFRVHKARPAHRGKVVKELAEEYFITDDMINIIYKKMAKLVQQDLQLNV